VSALNKKITIEIELSDWAKFVATDAGGEIWEFEKEPKKYMDVWENSCGGKARCRYIAEIKPPKNWKDSLIRVEDL